MSEIVEIFAVEYTDVWCVLRITEDVLLPRVSPCPLVRVKQQVQSSNVMYNLGVGHVFHDVFTS